MLVLLCSRKIRRHVVKVALLVALVLVLSALVVAYGRRCESDNLVALAALNVLLLSGTCGRVFVLGLLACIFLGLALIFFSALVLLGLFFSRFFSSYDVGGLFNLDLFFFAGLLYNLDADFGSIIDSRNRSLFLCGFGFFFYFGLSFCNFSFGYFSFRFLKLSLLGLCALFCLLGFCFSRGSSLRNNFFLYFFSNNRFLFGLFLLWNSSLLHGNGVFGHCSSYRKLCACLLRSLGRGLLFSCSSCRSLFCGLLLGRRSLCSCCLGCSLFCLGCLSFDNRLINGLYLDL